jgi:hypothetical protein
LSFKFEDNWFYILDEKYFELIGVDDALVVVPANTLDEDNSVFLFTY